MLRWLFGGGNREELSVTDQILAKLSMDVPNILSIFESYKKFPIELNTILLQYPEKVQMFFKELRDDDAIQFVALLTDPVIEKVVEASKDEQQPFYFSYISNFANTKAKEKSSIAFIKRIPKSYLIQMEYLKNIPSPILKASLFAALIDESFPTSEDEWHVIQPLLMAGFAKNPNYLRKITQALDDSTALSFIQRLPIEIIENFLQFTPEGDSFVLNELELDAKLASALIDRASNSLASKMVAKTYMSGNQTHHTIFSLYPAALLATFISKHEVLIKDQLRIKIFAEQMLNYMSGLQGAEFVSFTQALPAVILKFILERKTTKGEAFMALAMRHQDPHALDKIASEELFDAFLSHVQQGDEAHAFSSMAWLSGDRLAYFQARLQINNTEAIRPLREKLDFLIRRIPGYGMVDVLSVEKAFNSYSFLRYTMLEQLSKMEWVLPSGMLSMLWSTSNATVKFDITLLAEKVPASAKTAFECYEKINTLIKHEKQGKAVDWVQEERNILDTLKSFCIDQTLVKPSVALSTNEKAFYESLHSGMVDRQDVGPRVKIFLNKK